MAINWGDAVNAAWLVVAGVCVYFNASPRRFAASTTAHAVGFLNLSLTTEDGIESLEQT
jgi:hypothetical protein